jgi:hypothetical protein
MLSKYFKILLFPLLFSFMLYLSFKPWDFTHFMQHILMFLLLLLFPLAITINYIQNKMKGFWLSALFFFIGLLFLYRGFYMHEQFYVLDYFIKRNIEATIVTGNKIIYGEPISLWWVESAVIYFSLSILGLIVGYFVERKRNSFG